MGAVASVGALTAMVIDSLPLLALAGVAALVSGVFALSAGRSEPPKVERAPSDVQSVTGENQDQRKAV
jgi:hypothetical protein